MAEIKKLVEQLETALRKSLPLTTDDLAALRRLSTYLQTLLSSEVVTYGPRDWDDEADPWK